MNTSIIHVDFFTWLESCGIRILLAKTKGEMIEIMMFRIPFFDFFLTGFFLTGFFLTGFFLTGFFMSLEITNEILHLVYREIAYEYLIILLKETHHHKVGISCI